MIGLKIQGKTYNFKTNEISNIESIGVVAGIENRSVRLWINGSSVYNDCPCDILICREESTNNIINIPVFLMTKFIDHEEINLEYTVSGDPFVFISPDRNTDFYHLQNQRKVGYIAGKYICPAIKWGKDFENNHHLTPEYFIVCYTDHNGSVNYDEIIFLEEKLVDRNYGNLDEIINESNKRSSNPPIIIRGIDGKDGADGKDGEDGKDGSPGRDGVNGKDGRDGVDGKDGRDGVDGRDGRDGRDGVDGRDGIDGNINPVPGFYVSDTPPVGSGTSDIIEGSMWYNTTNAKTYAYVHSTNFYWLLISDTSK